MPELLDDIVSRYFVQQPGGKYVPKFHNFKIHSDYTSVDGTLYRAHPSYRGRQWNDWFTIEWRKHHTNQDMTPPIPAKVMMFISYTIDRVEYHEAIIRSGAGSNSPTKVSVFASKFKLQETKKGRPKFQCILAEQMGPHCFCFPNFGSETEEHFMVADRNTWADEFCLD
jgi:hypothetical protein